MKGKKVRIVSFLVAAATCLLVVILQYKMNVMQNHYWVCHLLFGFGFTYLVVGLFDSFKIASAFTLVWSFGNELIQDHLDKLSVNPNAEYVVNWDHLAADIAGWVIALICWLVVSRIASGHESNRV
jgi:hypothetical protein